MDVKGKRPGIRYPSHNDHTGERMTNSNPMITHTSPTMQVARRDLLDGTEERVLVVTWDLEGTLDEKSVRQGLYRVAEGVCALEGFTENGSRAVQRLTWEEYPPDVMGNLCRYRLEVPIEN